MAKALESWPVVTIDRNGFYWKKTIHPSPTLSSLYSVAGIYYYFVYTPFSCSVVVTFLPFFFFVIISSFNFTPSASQCFGHAQYRLIIPFRRIPVDHVTFNSQYCKSLRMINYSKEY